MVVSQVQQFLTKWMVDQGARVESMLAEYGQLQQKGAEQAKQTMQEWTKLTQATMNYGMELNEQWQKLSLEAARRALEMVTHAPKG
ncbi:MAG: hypothetical protein RMJ98_05990 [Myxococcales bacterium]|nr:hypothetical protein [Polyangiaceae bacterium]MDW8248839.1 hypothetical protein [Myxococcales bacterium]